MEKDLAGGVEVQLPDVDCIFDNHNPVVACFCREGEPGLVLMVRVGVFGFRVEADADISRVRFSVMKGFTISRFFGCCGRL